MAGRDLTPIFCLISSPRNFFIKLLFGPSFPVRNPRGFIFYIYHYGGLGLTLTQSYKQMGRTYVRRLTEMSCRITGCGNG